MKFILVVVYLILTLCGLIFIKLGGNPGTFSMKDSNLLMSMNLISGIGFVCYICSFLLFTKMVVIFDLSYISPICTGIVQVAVLVASYYIFKENISLYGIIGASLIIIGVIIMNIKTDNKDVVKNINNVTATVQELNVKKG